MSEIYFNCSSAVMWSCITGFFVFLFSAAWQAEEVKCVLYQKLKWKYRAQWRCRVTDLNEDCCSWATSLADFLQSSIHPSRRIDTACYLGLAPGKDFFSYYLLLLIAARLHFTSVNQAPLCQTAGCVNITKAHRRGGIWLPSLHGHFISEPWVCADFTFNDVIFC